MTTTPGHGTQTCQSCGGYVAPTGLSADGQGVDSQCKSCGTKTSKPKNNTLAAALGATAKDFE